MNCEKLIQQREVGKEEQKFTAEIAKETIHYMSKFGVPFTPRNYKEWFYVLCKAKEEKHLINEKNLEILFEKYVHHNFKILDDQEITAITNNLQEIADTSRESLDAFQNQIEKHDGYIDQSIEAIEEKDVQKMGQLKEKIHDLEEENRHLKEILEENRKRLELIENEFKKQAKEAEIDELTKVYNRKAFQKDIEAMDLSKIPYSLIIVDVDNFKKINDTFGHLVGDKILQELGEIFNTYVRTGTKVYRYGGEEFVIILPHTDLEGAKKLALRLKEVIAHHAVKLEDEKSLTFTASFGVAQKREGESYKEVLERADEALYQAKKEGKNRVVVKE